MAKKQFRIVGINRTQDASITLFENGDHCTSIHKERITRVKHDWGKVGDLQRYKESIKELSEPIDLVVECFSSDKEIENENLYQEEINESLVLADGFKRIHISHHLAHLYSAYPVSNFSESAGLVVDFQGSYQKDFNGEYPTNGDTEGLEVTSYYDCVDGEVKCIKKQIWDGDRSHPKGLGAFYHMLSKSLFSGSSPEGKVMGLCSFGDPEAIDMPELIFHDGEVDIPQEWVDIFQDRDTYNFNSKKKSFQEKANLAALGQKLFQETLLKAMNWLQEQTGHKNLSYAGGCGLNVIANSYVDTHSNFNNIFIPPSPHDGGTSVGCAIYGLTQVLHQPLSFRWKNDYLGPKINFERVTDIVANNPELEVEKLNNAADRCTDLIKEGNIIGLFQSNSEFGPRALGNRSFIADPRYSITKFFINHKIKGREWFRPIAPIIRTDNINKYFESDKDSPFMLYIDKIKPEYENQLDALAHKDNTARVQTIAQEQNPFVYSLLKSYEEKTGLGVLLNTSFNKKGDPIVETIEDAIDCLINTSLNYLLVGDYLIFKKTLAQNPLEVDDLH